jgi:hypothetical protein
MGKSFDETLEDAKRAVDTVKAWTASERHQYELGRAAGRAEGIREAIAWLHKKALPLAHQMQTDLLTAPPPPAATPVCTCGYVTTLGVVRSNVCPKHATKPAEDSHGARWHRGVVEEPARKAVCGTCGGTGDAAYGPCPDCVTRKPCETCAEHGATMRQIHATCPECGSR